MSITDSQLLAAITAGDIIVPLSSPATIEIYGRTVKAYGIAGRCGDGSASRWAFSLRIAGERRTIVRSKLVYMAGSLRTVPDDFEIHHLDHNRHNDDFENLVALHREDHRKIHAVDDVADTLKFLES